MMSNTTRLICNLFTAITVNKSDKHADVATLLHGLHQWSVPEKPFLVGEERDLARILVKPIYQENIQQEEQVNQNEFKISFETARGAMCRYRPIKPEQPFLKLT